MDHFLNEPQEFTSSYDHEQLYAFDLYNSGSSIASSSHLGSPSPRYDEASNFFDFIPFGIEPGDCSQAPVLAPVAVAPQDLHPQPFFQTSYIPAEQGPPLMQDMFATSLEDTPLVSPLATSESPEPPVMPNPLFPMKKDRDRGRANLQRSSKDPERQNGCTMCIRKFKRRADLARHIKRHEGVRPYECLAKSCPLLPAERFFFRADARQRHWRAHPLCESEFYLTPQGIEWTKKNRNRSQKKRGMGRRSAHNSRDTSLEASSDDFNDDDDADYHD